MRLWILTDGNDQIGIGHVMRCIALAQTARELQMEPCFFVESTMAVEQIVKYGFPTICLNESDRFDRDSTILSEICDKISQKGQGPVLIDGYQYSTFLKTSLSERFFTVFFDDMEMSHGIGEMTINYSPGYREFSYGNKSVEQGYLLGPAYFPLRNELKVRTSKKITECVRNVLVLTGGSQLVQGEEIVTFLSDSINIKEIQTIRFIGKAFRQSELIKNGMTIQCIPFSNEIYEDYQWADLIITACGISIFEIMYLGIPMICFQLADNQKVNMKFVQQSQLAFITGDIVHNQETTLAKILEGLQLMCSDPAIREAMSESGKKTIDGQGSDRILSYIQRQYYKNIED